MIRSGIVMASGAGLLLAGTITMLSLGGQPQPSTYDDFGKYKADWETHMRQSVASTIILGTGGAVSLGGAIAFAAGAIRYRRGKKTGGAAARGLSLRPTIDGFALSF